MIFHVRKIFDRSEVMKEKLRQSEQKEGNKKTQKSEEKKKNQTIFLKQILFEIYFIVIL